MSPYLLSMAVISGGLVVLIGLAWWLLREDMKEPFVPDLCFCDACGDPYPTGGGCRRCRGEIVDEHPGAG